MRKELLLHAFETTKRNERCGRVASVQHANQQKRQRKVGLEGGKALSQSELFATEDWCGYGSPMKQSTDAVVVKDGP